MASATTAVGLSAATAGDAVAFAHIGRRARDSVRASPALEGAADQNLAGDLGAALLSEGAKRLPLGRRRAALGYCGGFTTVYEAVVPSKLGSYHVDPQWLYVTPLTIVTTQSEGMA